MRNESSLSRASVAVPSDRASTLESSQGRPRGTYSSGKAIEKGRRMTEVREMDWWYISSRELELPRVFPLTLQVGRDPYVIYRSLIRCLTNRKVDQRAECLR